MAARKRMRMAELALASGVSRDTIHYYLREGLLPKPLKSGKTVAYYEDAHLERLRLIRRFREEKYLPVAVIRRLLESGPKGAQDRDLDTLADVLSIDPTLSRPDASVELLDDETTRVALQLGLLGENVSNVEPEDPTEGRVLSAVAEALALEGDARQLTLDDMQACGCELTRLVSIEAGLFFDLVIKTGDTPRSVQALRAGRTAVAHFITAFRDLMLRRIADDVLSAISSGPKALAAARGENTPQRAV
jgi:DNA-binding transcriptional MerR regulator